MKSSFYGIKDEGWLFSHHCFTRYIKLTFFRSAGMEPPSSEKSEVKDVQ